MKLTKKSLANALGLTIAIVWAVCSVFVALLPDFSMVVTKWWMHGMDITLLGNWNLNLANFLLGGITLAISGWLFGYVLGWSLEYFSEK